jgi:uncharacterized protein
MTDASLHGLLQAIHDQYPLSWLGLHGVGHWARVYENGLRLAPATGANVEILLLFALFHDARRTNEGWDEGHGRRGADYAASLLSRKRSAMRGGAFDLSSSAFDLLYHACAFHTDGLIDGDPTVQTCWDADRLDLPRAGIHPSPDRLCTPVARAPGTIAWAADRSQRRFVPTFVDDAWAVVGEAVPPEPRGNR